jgi:hypothetical protein
LQENKHKRSGKLTFYDSCHVTSRSGCHLRCHACKLSHLRCRACMPHHQSKGGKPQRIRVLHMDFTWIHGPTRAPKPPQEHVHTEDQLKDPQDSHPEDKFPPRSSDGDSKYSSSWNIRSPIWPNKAQINDLGIYKQHHFPNPNIILISLPPFAAAAGSPHTRAKVSLSSVATLTSLTRTTEWKPGW